LHGGAAFVADIPSESDEEGVDELLSRVNLLVAWGMDMIEIFAKMIYKV